MDIRFVGRHLAIGKNFSKIPITLDRRPKGTNPLGVFHTSLRSIYHQKMNRLEIFITAHNIFNGSQYWDYTYPNPARWIEGGVRFKF